MQLVANLNRLYLLVLDLQINYAIEVVRGESGQKWPVIDLDLVELDGTRHCSRLAKHVLCIDSSLVSESEVLLIVHEKDKVFLALESHTQLELDSIERFNHVQWP